MQDNWSNSIKPVPPWRLQLVFDLVARDGEFVKTSEKDADVAVSPAKNQRNLPSPSRIPDIHFYDSSLSKLRCRETPRTLPIYFIHRSLLTEPNHRDYARAIRSLDSSKDHEEFSKIRFPRNALRRVSIRGSERNHHLALRPRVWKRV